MVRSIVKSPPLLLAAFVALGLAMAVGLWLPGQAGAQASNTAERTLSADEVRPGVELTVTITHTIGTGGVEIKETLPDGFTYVGGSATHAGQGDDQEDPRYQRAACSHLHPVR